MRQWNINPKFLCNQHLLGEHVEHHMFAGCIMKNKSIKGYIDKGLVEIHNLWERHHILSLEMLRRGMNHNSPFPDIELYEAGKIDISKNIKELMNRCPECRKLIRGENNMSPTELYSANLKTIKGKAYEYHRRAPHIPIEEFESEANEIFVKAMNSYNPNMKTSFTTYLNRCLHNNLESFLIYFVLDWIELQEYLLQAKIINNRVDQELNLIIWIKSLSQKSQQIISIIFNTKPDEISGKYNENRITKYKLQQYLRKLDWKYTDIWNCFNEISLALERL